MQVVDRDAPHLGGYVAGGDPWTDCTALWSWLVHDRGVRSVLDVGCGDGYALSYFKAQGCEVLGVEGLPQEWDLIVRHDYITGPYDPGRRFDLCWCCEFVEHVEQRFEHNFMVSFMACELLLMTHACPGQEGHHHVNCQSASYWITRLHPWFDLDAELTVRARRLCELPNHFARSGLAFRRRPSG
jgi:hypothetical protein